MSSTKPLNFVEFLGMSGNNKGTVMSNLFLILLSFFASVVLTSIWPLLARVVRLYDEPVDRSSHKKKTPTGVGIAFALIFILGTLCWLISRDFSQETLTNWYSLLLALLLLSVMGCIDDFKPQSIILRLSLQIISIGLLIYSLPGAVLPSMFTGLPQAVWYFLLALGLLWLVNLNNFMDGIDGLAVMQALFVTSGYYLLGDLPGDKAFPLQLIIVVLVPFLIGNWFPAKVFMGDAGSQFLGALIPALGLWLVAYGLLQLYTVLILLSLFISDASVTLLMRFNNGDPWYHGHKTHLYQLLAVKLKRHSLVVFLYTALNCMWLLPLAILTEQGLAPGLWLTLIAYLPLLFAVYKLRRRLV